MLTYFLINTQGRFYVREWYCLRNMTKYMAFNSWISRWLVLYYCLGQLWKKNNEFRLSRKESIKLNTLICLSETIILILQAHTSSNWFYKHIRLHMVLQAQTSSNCFTSTYVFKLGSHAHYASYWVYNHIRLHIDFTIA